MSRSLLSQCAARFSPRSPGLKCLSTGATTESSDGCRLPKGRLPARVIDVYVSWCIPCVAILHEPRHAAGEPDRPRPQRCRVARRQGALAVRLGAVITVAQAERAGDP